jgi:cysteine desulfurase/selenocysteine lyase
MQHLGVVALARASFYVYTRFEDIDALAEGVKRVQKVFA